jgi:hypothetical protein
VDLTKGAPELGRERRRAGMQVRRSSSSARAERAGSTRCAHSQPSRACAPPGRATPPGTAGKTLKFFGGARGTRWLARRPRVAPACVRLPHPPRRLARQPWRRPWFNYNATRRRLTPGAPIYTVHAAGIGATSGHGKSAVNKALRTRDFSCALLGRRRLRARWHRSSRSGCSCSSSTNGGMTAHCSQSRPNTNPVRTRV